MLVKSHDGALDVLETSYFTLTSDTTKFPSDKIIELMSHWCTCP